MKKNFSGYSYTDDQTKKALKKIYSKKKYIADPHGAIGYLGLNEYLSRNKDDLYGVFLETAHPVKFLDTVESTLRLKVPIPGRLEETLSKKKVSIPIRDYNDLRSYLLD